MKSWIRSNFTRKAESTHQEVSQGSLGPFQDKVSGELNSDPEMVFTAAILAERLECSPQQVRPALQKIVKNGLAEKVETPYGSGSRAKGKF